MVSIDEAFVDSAAPNLDAAKNGRALVLKRKFTGLHISSDQTLLFGYCQGSGKTPYLCSSDFAQPATPVHRCSCPSRQFPCKHSLGLMYAFVQNATAFSVADIPAELQAKREKAEERAEKKKADTTKPKKVNLSALAKKIQAQLDGIQLLEQLTLNLVSIGIGNMNAKSAHEIESRALQLGDAYLPGAQAALRAYTRLFARGDGAYDDSMSTAAKEAIYSEALDQLARLSALIKQGRNYLEKRLADPSLAPDTESSIAAWLGHAWQLNELREAGKVREQVEMMQLAFNMYDDVARMEYVDTGLWIDLADGSLFQTHNYRPYKAVKFIRAEDSFYQIAQIPQLCVYPGDLNPRVRWDGMTTREPEPKDFAQVRSHASRDFTALVKQIKNNLKGPLSEKQPVCLLDFRTIGKVGDDLVVEDHAGTRLTMTDRGIAEEPATLHLLPHVPAEALQKQTLVARFRHDLDSLRLQIKPLAIVTDRDVIRLSL